MPIRGGGGSLGVEFAGEEVGGGGLVLAGFWADAVLRTSTLPARNPASSMLLVLRCELLNIYLP